jgi:hypothetical protein
MVGREEHAMYQYLLTPLSIKRAQIAGYSQLSENLALKIGLCSTCGGGIT